uniref:Retrotransposon protein, putative, Ty1-copia subclass n=1 Tax=Oryza sativa subsp. japonica TaxID=39947 RepID=Q2QWG7_ORYSJ|nr:retrotransposon protein, putative, Ty1-copia subclass [Oryza sativa Japonica Group]
MSTSGGVNEGAPGTGDAPIDNTNGGSSASQSSGGTFTGYNILLLFLFSLLLRCNVSWGKRSEPPFSPEEEVKFEASDFLFRGALISVLADNIVDVYMHTPSGKDMWDALEAKFGVSDAGMEQAHEIQMLAKELENNNCELPDKFVAGGIIAKLPPSWSDFATSLKHKRQEFSKKNPHASHNNKKVKPDVKPKATTNFKKKGKGKAKGDCFVCGKSGHWAKDCPERKDRKSANMVICEAEEYWGTDLQLTPPYSPQSNGAAERKNCTLTEMVNAMLDTAGLSKERWGEAILTACHVLNKIPTKHKEVTPFEEWERKKLNLSYLRIRGCLAKVNVPIAKKRKLGPNTVDCVFLSYAIHSVGYRFLIVNSGVPDMRVGTIIESRDATFFDNEFPMKNIPSTSSQETVIPHEHFAPIQHNDQAPEGNPEEDNIADTRKSKRQRVAKSFGDDYIVYFVDDTPRTIEEAYSSPDADYWKEAVRSEMDSIMSNGTWEVVERPYGCKPVGCKWVFKKKLRPDGTIEKYKARLVAKGYTQKEGEDFFDTYSPVARLTTIRVLLALAASHGLLVHQMDVKTAFLNGELDEEIYMDQPDGYVLEGQEGMVCKLLKSLYGLKQAPKQWHKKFDTTLTSVGFVVNEADKCVYYRYGGGEGVILCLYVDDILIFGTSLNVNEEVKDFLSKSFEMKDLGEADVILNIKLLRGDEGGITLVQSHYVDKVLSGFGYSDCKPAPTPYDPNVLLRKNRRIARDQLRYSQIIGSLMYLASATRPDISFAVSKLSRFVSNPGDDHWQALERVMRYLKGTMSYGIHYTGYPKVLEGYSD